MGHTEPKAVVHTVTSARSSTAAHKRHREVQYLTMMGIRVICFGLLFVTSGWMRWVCILAAVLLPYFAVVLANAVRPGQPGVMTPVDDRTKRIER
ncbi:MAG: DUF3099 domain-containing protein [Micrococcales bacterium]|nr:DUF3099 domain-containing protein [Micrococcales bacterium]